MVTGTYNLHNIYISKFKEYPYIKYSFLGFFLKLN